MKFIAGEAAAVVGSSLVVSDVHLGIEYGFQKKGIRLFPEPTKIAARIRALMANNGCSSLVVIGDLKDDVTGFEERERRMVRQFMAELGAPVTVAKGNHDSQLEGIPCLEVKPAEGFVLEVREAGPKANKKAKVIKYGICHGHAWPGKPVLAADVLLIGNSHPVVELRDSMGMRWREKCWLSGFLKKSKQFGTKKQKTIVFPAFSQLSGGAAVNVLAEFEILGPLFRNEVFDLERAEVTLLNGVRLGTVASLRQ